ncbi:RNA-directed DNA methylation 4 [Magnolia sinica]|uniref:RNA-directed DNA methylation 4 n=1 Tax=Magnolia sinica TaxID=86752 RepID=UPI002657D931|nr:RNA-directed DNA methylation 4 [Magnolia sinica]
MASSSSDSKDEKPVVVRVKRKSSQEPLDAFWLEISERPLKRPFLDFQNLSISDSSAIKEELKTKKLLVQHLETVSSSEATKDILQSVRPNSGDVKEFRMKLEERRHRFKQDNRHDQLRSTARQKHEDLVKSARFEQIWKRRKGNKGAVPDDSLHEFCHLYDVVRVDVGEERSSNVQETSHLDDNAILCNYLPLIREFLPAAASEIESDMASYRCEQDGYVYDLYTVGNDLSMTVEDDCTMYPLVQVDNDDDYYDGPLQCEFESDDSNAEDNPLNDYPDEESSDDEEVGSKSSYDQSEDDGSACEDEEEILDGDDEDDWRWEHR